MTRTAYPCQCVLIIRGNREMLNLCGGHVNGPDQPMCADCEQRGHAISPEQLPLTDPRRAGLFGGLERLRNGARG